MRLLVLSLFWCGADLLDFGIAAARHFLIAGLDDDVALFPESLQIFAHSGFHSLAVESVHDFGLDFFIRLFAFGEMFENLKNQEPLLGFDDRSNLLASS